MVLAFINSVILFAKFECAVYFLFVYQINWQKTSTYRLCSPSKLPLGTNTRAKQVKTMTITSSLLQIVANGYALLGLSSERSRTWPRTL